MYGNDALQVWHLLQFGDRQQIYILTDVCVCAYTNTIASKHGNQLKSHHFKNSTFSISRFYFRTNYTRTYNTYLFNTIQ